MKPFPKDAPPLRKRPAGDSRMRDEYLRTGTVPFDLLVRRGLASLVRDPFLTFIKYLQGPIGLKARQWYWRRKFGHMGKGVAIDPEVNVEGAENIYLDDFAYLGWRAMLIAKEGYIKVGKRCHLLTTWVLGYGGVEIGNYVGLGQAAILSASDSHKDGARMAGPMIPMEQRNIQYGKVVIHDDAFVGHYSMVMPGVTIGEGAIVAPHSMVLKDVEPWTVVMGSPARKVSEREKVRFSPPD